MAHTPQAKLSVVIVMWQVRECATALLHVAKRQGVPVFLVGHVTKVGWNTCIHFCQAALRTVAAIFTAPHCQQLSSSVFLQDERRHAARWPPEM